MTCPTTGTPDFKRDEETTTTGENLPTADTSFICPDYNLCCETGCVTGSVEEDGSGGMCCVDDPHTGCKVGYQCWNDEPNEPSTSSLKCKRVNDNPDLPVWTPRIQTCVLPARVYTELQGLSILEASNANLARTTTANQTTSSLLYLSTMGAIDSSNHQDIQSHLRVQTVFVFVHGSLRNVDDYICGGNAALPPEERNPENSTVLLLAPWFLAPEDGPVDDRIQNELRWDLYGQDEEHTSYHWRYGGNALDSTISSFGAIDELLNRIMDDPIRFPQLRRIIVAGHSAGGQFVQRWSLLSNSKAFQPSPQSGIRGHSVSVKVGVANPKSFSYLDERRYINETFQVPTKDIIEDCPSFNEWLWGMGDELLDVPYKEKAIKQAGGLSRVFERYSNRDIVYLAGEKDTVPNGYCMDKLQGDFRKERSALFYASLREIFGRQVHDRRVVRDVHHDHCLIFQSKEARESIFKELWVS